MLNTLAAYRRDLVDFAGHANPARASRDEVRAFLNGLSTSGQAASTQARKLSALRQFYGFLYMEGFRSDDPTQTIEAPQARRPLPKILSGSDLQAMLESAAQDQRPEGLRLTLIVEMLYGGRLARFRACGDDHGGGSHNKRISSCVTGKGNKERLAPLSPAARTALQAYLAVREQFVPKARQEQPLSFRVAGRGRLSHPPPLSPTAQGSGAQGGHRSRQGLARMCCAMPSPPIWSKAARICAACRRCWAMPTSPPPRSTPMWRRDHLSRVMPNAHPLGKTKTCQRPRLTHWAF